MGRDLEEDIGPCSWIQLFRKMQLLYCRGKMPCYNLDTFLQKTIVFSHFPAGTQQFPQKHCVFCHLSFPPLFPCTTLIFLGASARTGNPCCQMQRAQNRQKGAWSCHLTVALLEKMYNHKLQSWFYFCCSYFLGSHGAPSPTPEINLTELQDLLMPLYQACPCFPWLLVQCVDELRWSLDRQWAWSVMKFLIQNKNQKAMKIVMPILLLLLPFPTSLFSWKLFQFSISHLSFSSDMAPSLQPVASGGCSVVSSGLAAAPALSLQLLFSFRS